MKPRPNHAVPDLIFFAAAIGIVNIPLLWGEVWDALVFLPDRVLSGDWWRLLTHPLVHVGGYHLLLDAGAFLLLYGGLEEASRLRRLTYVGACAFGGLLVPLLSAPQIFEVGLCGLSGTAHGLMAVYGLELLDLRGADKGLRMAGLGCTLVVVVKSLVEIVQGAPLFGFFHLGDVGLPIAACHAGGVLGGLTAYGLLHHFPSLPAYSGRLVVQK
jgi:rhomboid family GlyGly-CTERM serine protease